MISNCKYCEPNSWDIVTGLDEPHQYGCPNHEFFKNSTHANKMPKAYRAARSYFRKIKIKILEVGEIE